MFVALLFIALFQDGPVETARPASTVDFSAYAEVVRARQAQAADPGPACTFGGRPVVSPRCPATQGRLAANAPALEPGTRPVAAGEETDPWAELNGAGLRQASPGEGGYSRSRAAGGSVQPVETSDGDCSAGANGASGPSGFDCALRLARARRAAGYVESPGTRVLPERPDIPAWAFADPARWELNQCDDPDDACRRQARNRLAIARAGLAADAPAAEDAEAGGAQNCRMVMQRSAEGFGGSLSRVCGDEAAAGDLLRQLDIPARPAPEPCDRPASLESHDAWIARCRALPPR